MTDRRYGRRKFSKMYAELCALRVAIRGHDPEATEAAWGKCEEWIDAVFMKGNGNDSGA